ncbi:hypothetical protein [Enterococcus lactis]|uniref:hypothetical protein n=1 Tax=Enterococcus lactis TaxID=357441 RepID=UPI0039A556A4
MKKVYQKCLWISYITLGIAVWNGNSFFDKFYKVQNFFPYAIPIVLDNEPPRM